MPSARPPSRMRRRTLAALGALALAGLVPGCGGRGPLRIASHVWPGYEFMFLARELGWLDAGKIRLIETPAASDSIHALHAGLVDGAALTLDEVLRVRAGGVSLAVVGVFDASAGADVVLARPGLGDLAALAGRTVAVEHSALGALMLSGLLGAAGLTASQVRVVHVTYDQHEAYWNSGRADAIVSYPPVSERLERGGAVRLFDSRSMPDAIFDVLAVTPQAAADQAESVRHLLDAHFRALEHFHTHPHDAAYRLASRLHVPPEGVPAAYHGIRLANHAENMRLLGGVPSVLEARARELATVMARERILPEEVGLDGIVNPAFIMPAS